MRKTRTIVATLQALAESDAWTYGLEIRSRTGLAAGTLYPILSRFLNEGMVQDQWEDPVLSVTAGRPRRRYFRLTAKGEALIQEWGVD